MLMGTWYPRQAAVLLILSVLPAGCQRQAPGGSIGAVAGVGIEGNHGAWRSLMNRVDDGFE
jgi:hypothetical protein